MEKVAVIGDGGWGTTLSLLLNSKGIEVILWSYSSEYAEYLDKKRENTKFLGGIRLPEDIVITADVDTAKEADHCIFVVPCKFLRGVAERFKGAGFDYIVSATKGIENETLKRPSEILEEVLETGEIGVLSGPNISYEVANKFPTAAVLASVSASRKEAQKLLSTEFFRVYTSDDVLGVELGGALKNIVAIAAGISDGMGFDANTKAALLTRGLAEITRLGVKMGAKKETFSGLSGVGDLATTCMSSHSRNRWFGEEIGKGRAAKEVLDSMEMVVEGAWTARSAFALAGKHSVEMPITQKIFEIIYEGKDSRAALKELMARDLKEED